MFASSIGWILVVSGIITLGGGMAALVCPALFLRLGFGVESPASSALFFVRHWGVLIVAVAALISHSAYAPTLRAPVMIAAAFEKFAIGLLVFFGAVKRTAAMTAIAMVDGLFAVLYAAYLAAL
jgi:hypothetical protein